MNVIRRAAQVATFRKATLGGIALDHRATADAAMLVSGISVAGYVWNALTSGSFSIWLLVATAINAVTVWIVMAGLTFLIGKLVSGYQTAMATVMRLQGFAYLPLLAAVLIPNSPMATACRIWFLAVLVFATAEALETSSYLRAAVAVGGSLIGSFVIGQLFWGGRLF